VYKVEFEIGSGLAIPTQLVFVPMLFLLPLGLVPLCVAAAMLLADLVERLEGKIHPERMLARLGNAWYALRPALVLAAAGEPDASLERWPLLVAALAAQFAFDFGSAALDSRLTHGIPAREFVRYLALAWAVDVALAPVALLAAIVAVGDPWAFLLVPR